MNINYSTFVGTPVHPLLKDVLTAVFAKAPNLVFVAKRKALISDAGQAPVDHIAQFDVTFELEILGDVCVSRDRRGTACIEVRSDNIKKRRGSRDTKRTINPKVAAKACIEAFKPEPKNKVAGDILNAFRRAKNEIASRAENQLVSPVRFGSQVALEVSLFLADYKDGDSLSENIKERVKHEGLPGKALAYRASKNLNTHVDARSGMVLAAAPGGFLAVDLANPEVFRPLTDTYQLPTNYQEKLAILKLMDAGGPILNIGFKYESGKYGFSYFLAGGDTIVESM